MASAIVLSKHRVVFLSRYTVFTSHISDAPHFWGDHIAQLFLLFYLFFIGVPVLKPLMLVFLVIPGSGGCVLTHFNC